MMRWLIVAILLLLAMPANAQAIQRCSNTQTPCWTTATRPAAPGQGAFGYNTDTDIVEFYNGVAWTASANGEVNAKSFGAQCNSIADDTASINNAIAYAKTLTPAALKPARILIPAGACLISEAINMTGWSVQTGANMGPAVILSGYGAVLEVRSGIWPDMHPMIDMAGSFNIQIEGITLFGACTIGHQTSVGLQMGRISNNLSAGFHHFLDVKILGCFALAGIYNLASEQDLFTNPQVKMFNFSTSPAPAVGPPSNTSGPYGVIMDGSNHWDINSRSWSYVNAGSVAGAVTTIIPGTHQSFLANTFNSGAFTNVNNGIASALWLSGDIEELSIKNLYMHAPGTGGFCVYVQADSGSSTQFSIWDLRFHCEPGAVGAPSYTRTFYFGGAVAALVLHGWRFTDPASFASNTGAGTGGVYDIDSGSSVTSVSFQDAETRVERFASTGVVFSDPTKFIYSGTYYSSTSIQWNATGGTFNGRICLAGACTLYPAVVAFAQLPTCNAATKGAIYRLSPAAQISTPTYWTIAAAGSGASALEVPVMCDVVGGVFNWRYH